MNKDRRAAIDALIATVDELKNLLAETLNKVSAEDLANAISSVGEEEQEYYDNMAENLQGGERGTAASDAAATLNEASEAMSELASTLGEAETTLDNVIAQLEEAKGE